MALVRANKSPYWGRSFTATGLVWLFGLVWGQCGSRALPVYHVDRETAGAASVQW